MHESGLLQSLLSRQGVPTSIFFELLHPTPTKATNPITARVLIFNDDILASTSIYEHARNLESIAHRRN
jgi:hypothetical protein